MPNEGAKYFATTHGALINTSNSNLDGSGDYINEIYRAGLSAEITSIIIKSQSTTNSGMVRLFVYNNDTNEIYLFSEIMIPSIIQNSKTEAFEWEVISQGSLALETGFSIYASTQNSEPFSIIVEAFEWTYSF